MKLIEVFTKPKGKISWKTRSSSTWLGYFVVGGNREFAFYAVRQVSDSQIWPLTDKDVDKNKTWEVIFYQTKPKISDDITGGGKPIEVFNKALAAFKEFVKGAKPESIVFTAKEPSRIKLYNIMAKKVAKGLGFNLLSAQSGTYVLKSKRAK